MDSAAMEVAIRTKCIKSSYTWTMRAPWTPLPRRLGAYSERSTCLSHSITLHRKEAVQYICIVYKDSNRLYNVYIVCIRLYVMCMEERLSFFFLDVTIKYVVKKENLNLLFLNLYFIKKEKQYVCL